METRDHTSDRSWGLALILGAVAGIITMTFHPAPGSLARVAEQSAMVVGTHTLALISMPLTLIGFYGVSRRLRASRVLAPAAYITFAFGTAAGMVAGTINGLAVPELARRYAAPDYAVTGPPEGVEVVLAFSRALNGALARVFMVALAVAVLLWCLSILRTRALPRWLGWLGIPPSLVALATIFLGALGVSVHDFGLFIFGYSLWAIVVGVALWRTPRPEAV